MKGLGDFFPNHFSGNNLKIKNLQFLKIHIFSFYSFSLFTFHWRFHITCLQIVLCNELIPSKNLLVQNCKHNKNVRNVFQVNVNVCWLYFPLAWKLHKVREPMTTKKHWNDAVFRHFKLVPSYLYQRQMKQKVQQSQ